MFSAGADSVGNCFEQFIYCWLEQQYNILCSMTVYFYISQAKLVKSIFNRLRLYFNPGLKFGKLMKVTG